MVYFSFSIYIQSFPSGSNKVRSTSGFALFAYQVPNASEVVHLLPMNGTGPDENAKVTSSATKLGDASSATTAISINSYNPGNVMILNIFFDVS